MKSQLTILSIVAIFFTAYISDIDIEALQPDLIIPWASIKAPATGRRVRQFNEDDEGSKVYHLLYLTTDSVTGKSKHQFDNKSFDYSLKQISNLANDYHIYDLEGTKDSLIYSFDGNVIRKMKNEFCHSPAPVYLSEAIISWAGEVADAIDGTSMEVDWVKVYQLK